MDKAKIFYQKAEQKYILKSQKLKKQDRVIVAIRVLIFILSSVLLVYLANEQEVLIFFIFFFIFIVLFAFLVKKHHQLSYQLKYFTFLVEINHKEQKRLSGNFKEILPNGSEFINTKHSYTSDLDIFGKNSLFQFINRTTTVIGQRTLAKWLKKKTTKDEILLRQEAVKELSAKVEWRQDFQAKGMFTKADNKVLKKFENWLERKPILYHNSWYKILLIILPVIAVSSIISFSFFDTPIGYTLMALITNLSFLGKTAKKITELSEETVKNLDTLKAFANLIQMVEQEYFSSQKLKQLQKHFKSENFLASEEINKLTKILANLEVRQNAFFFMTVNLVFLYELIWTWKLEKWKSEKKQILFSWFETISEVEALNSFAALAFSYPQFCFPVITNKPFIYKTENLGHLLIHSNNRINNDFVLKEKGNTIIITGSNMSGKSTFLRTLGINAALAFAGSPVCASTMEISCFDIFTGMRIQDSLEENVSAFYAELQRIKMLFDKIDNGKQVFFMLDEILKGTNSKDRHNGVYNIVKRLISKDTFGLISTHDLALADLANTYEKVTNKSFGSNIINEELKFYYKINKGICNSFSATQLMKKIGIIEAL